MRVPLQIGVQSGEAASPPVSIERLLNGYLEQTPQGRNPTPVYGTPGLTLFADTPIRGLLEVRDVLFAATDTSLVRVSASGSTATLGAIPAGVCDMATDGTNVVVVVGGAIFVWNGSTLSEVTDEDAPQASSVDYLNGFFVFTEADTEQWFVAPQANPGGDYQALDFDSADTNPDILVRVTRLGRQLVFLGKRSIENWYYSGDSVFPFARFQDDPVDAGLVGVQAATATNETLFWLAHDLTVRRLDGRTATRISTFAVEKLIAGWSDPSATVATHHVWQGHLFVVLRNPDGCVVWDQATQRWHERQSNASATWRVSHYAYVYGKHLFGGDRLYELGGYDEAGAPLPFEMVFPWLDNGGERFSVNEVELRVEAGVGGTITDPKITLERTEDGEEWSTPLQRPFGRQGERFRRVVFSRQGQSRGCAFRVRITDAVKRVVYAAFAEVS